MVHRSADSRLLTNLLTHEKEYSKHLTALHDLSNNSLASFAAYAAASGQQTSGVVLSVAGSLAAADEALRRYGQGVDEWRESMRALKELEEEVGNIMRDREILVTRVIKASRSSKNAAGSIRDSLLLNHQTFTSASSLSLTSSPPDSPSPGASRPLSITSLSPLPSNPKLLAAQSELQACETHLASKEHELAVRRCTALKDGLGARMKAMAECGWAWGEIGREAGKVLDGLAGVRVEGMEGEVNGTSNDSRTSSPLVRNPVFTAQDMNRQSGHYSIPEPQVSHYMAGAEQHHFQQHLEHQQSQQHLQQLHQREPQHLHQQYSQQQQQQQHTGQYPAAPEIMESPMGVFSALGPVQSSSQHHQQPQEGQMPPPVSILSLVDPGAAFGVLRSETQAQAQAREDQVGEDGEEYEEADGEEHEEEVEEGQEREGHTRVPTSATTASTVTHFSEGTVMEREHGSRFSEIGLEHPDHASESEPTALPPAIPFPSAPTDNRLIAPQLDDRPPSNASSGTGASSLYYTPVTPTTYTTETISYAPAIAVHVGPGSAGHGSVEHGSSGGGHELGGQPLGRDEMQPVPSQHQYDHPISTASSGERVVNPYAPLSRKEYFEEDLHKSVKIPPAHAIGEYDMPVISPSDSLQHQQQQRGRDGSPVKRNSLLMRLGSLGGGGSGRSSSPNPSQGPGSSGPHTPVVETAQVGDSGFTRHVLERRITEEEGRVSMGSQPGHGVSSYQPPLQQHQQQHQPPLAREEDDASEESDERRAKEGELTMVENPRFMSEERRRELARKKEKEEARKVREEEKARAKGKEKGKEKEKGKDKGKGKQKEVPESDDAEGGDEDTPKASKTRNRQISFVKQKKAAESQSTMDDSAHTHGSQTSPGKMQASPSKGFLGSIKGLFSARLDAPGRKEHRRAMSEVVQPSSTKAGGDEEGGERAAARVDSDDDSSIVQRSPTKSSGFHLFGGRKKGNKETKEKEMKWETRTDRNLKKLEAAAVKAGSSPAGRKFSLDERGRAGGAAGGGGGRGVVEHEGGGIQRVMRAASVTANGSNASLLSDARNERDRKKLRKTRGGGGGAGVTEVPGGQQRQQEEEEAKASFPKNEPAGAVTPVRRAPSQVVKSQPQQQGQQQGPPTKTGLSHRRSASIDVGVQQRRSFVESEARKTNAENEIRRGNVSGASNNSKSNGEGDRRSYADAESDHGTVNGIVDLGSRRRRAASEAGREQRQYGAVDNVPPMPSHEPVLMGYVPTAPGSVLGSVNVYDETTPVHVERTPALSAPAPKPIQLEPYVRPREEVVEGSAQRKTSILKTRKASSDVGQPTTSTSTTTTAYPPPMPMKTPTAPPPVSTQTSSASPPLSRRQSTRVVPTAASPAKAQSQPQAHITSPKQASTSPSKLPTSASPSKLPTSASSPSKATVLPAGGDHPSGTLVAQAGWNAPHPQTTLAGAAGGVISRNTSVRSAASAPSGDGQGVPQSRGAGKRQKQSVLGQGMPTTTISGSGVGRHASLGHASGMAMGQQLHSQQQYQPVQQQQQTSPQSLLKIIEDVANVNKKGPISGGIGIPSAPPRVLTEKLKAMDQDAFRSQVGASPVPGQSHGAAHARTKSPSTTTTTTTASQGLWEIKAPGSVWDQRQALMEQQQAPPKKSSGIYNREASMSAPDLTSTGVSRSRSVKSPRPVAAAPVVGGGQMLNGHVGSSLGSSSGGPPQPAKMPLRSAMRHPSRTPSPLVSGSPHARAGSGPASTSSYNSPLTRHESLAAPATSPPQHQPSPLVREAEKKKDKGKQKAVEPETEDTGAESSAYETGNEAFYTDEESGAEGRWKEKEKKPILAAPVPYGGPSTLSGAVNGHAVGYGASDVSRSDTSTGTPHASASDHQQPRRRKSVRVSLKPTFSPSPPAIEYDEYEEQERHAPWAWGPKAGSSSQYDSIEKRASEQPGPSSSYNPTIASPAPQAPAKQHVIVKQQKVESSKDIWEDSSDDDEAYLKAKKALSEAAKFEKDVTLMVANRRF